MNKPNIHSNIDHLIDLALEEDINHGDHSSQACIPENAKGACQLLVKEHGILAGMDIAKRVFTRIDPDCQFDELLKDGDRIRPGDIAFTISSSNRNLLKGERLALNYMQRMSGIATRTKEYVDLIKHTSTTILDTRKTTPNNRIFEKLAVKIGGGSNHRFGLYDMIMLKDNHIDFAGGVQPAIDKTKQYLIDNKLDLKIEIEVRDFDELNEVLSIGGVDRIMLDNFSPADTRIALKSINNRFETESSGGITKETLKDYAETGVDFISIGALTHQINSLDLSLKAIS